MHQKKYSLADYCTSDEIAALVKKFIHLTRDNPLLLSPFRDDNPELRRYLSQHGLELYLTVKKTTLMYSKSEESFIKILHPLNLKQNILYMFGNTAGSIYDLSLLLRERGVPVPRVTAYGRIKRGNKIFFIMDRVPGMSVLDLFNKNGMDISDNVIKSILDGMTVIHKNSFWLGDAHPSHMFVNDNVLSGFIDIDSIRKNHLQKISLNARDMAWLNHPGIVVDDDRKQSWIDYYMYRMKIKEQEKFKALLKNYSLKRWK